MNVVSGIAILVVVIYSLTIFGKPGREKDLLSDIPQIQKLIPAGEHVGVCEEVNSNFVYHVYLQRFHHLELTRDSTHARFYLTDLKCGGPELGYGLLHDGQLLKVYKVEEPE